MKRLHIIQPYNSAAMQRMSQPLQELSSIYEVSTSDTVDVTADVNIHMPWHSMVGLEDKGSGKHIIAYTHCNAGAQASLIDACERADLITCMSYQGRRELVELGVDPRKLWVIYAAADSFTYRPRVIGVVGYPQPNGRKREHLLLDLAWKYDLSAFQFLLVGDGYEELAAQMAQLTGVDVLVATNAGDDVMRELYGRMDVLLVTGYAEGGPLPLLEAMAAGVPVISPDFGYASDLLGEVDTYSNAEELMALLTELSQDAIDNHKLARAWSWRDYAAEYALVIGRLIGESVDLYPERGMSRYAQLLDIIDGERPSDIVEIGTWNGNTALRMIQTAAKYRPIDEIYYQGFDLFESMTGEQFRRELSKHGWDARIVQRRLEATGADIDLIPGDTNQTLLSDVGGIDGLAELYFVDGGHSESTIDNDAGAVLENMTPNATAIFDDYYHENKPDGMGCNKVIDNLDRNEYEVLHLPTRTIADDGREIGMVKVRRRANIRLQMSTTASTGSTTYYFAGYGGPSDTVYIPSVWTNDAPSTPTL